MVEAASADAVADAGLIYIAGIDEETTAIAALDGAVPTVITGTVSESATATALTDATAISGADVTTTGVRGPLFMFDATFPSASLTVIDMGR
jgi:heptaprenylglyceryl phosphate synthase